MIRPRKRNAGPTLLAVVGILVMLTGMAFHFWRPDLYPLEWSVQLIGAAIAFAGFYAMDSTRAKDGGNFLIDAGTRIVGVIRTGGRRNTDPPVLTPVTPATPAPLVPPIEEPPPTPDPLRRDG
jgi:hypothetical protein